MKLLISVLFLCAGIDKHFLAKDENSKSIITMTLQGNIQDTAKKPAVTLEETIVKPINLLAIRDTANSMAEISLIFNKDYGELFTYINQNGLTSGKVMAFYYSVQLPFILDAAVETDKLPNQTTGRIKVNKVVGGNAIIAHYNGPYEQVNIAYTAITNWLKENNKTAKGVPFEVYLNEPDSVKDPYDLRTDVYQLIK